MRYANALSLDVYWSWSVSITPIICDQNSIGYSFTGHTNELNARWTDKRYANQRPANVEV